MGLGWSPKARGHHEVLQYLGMCCAHTLIVRPNLVVEGLQRGRLQDMEREFLCLELRRWARFQVLKVLEDLVKARPLSTTMSHA